MLLPSYDLVETIERSERDYTLDRMRAIQLREGNVEQVEILRLGRAVCFYSKTMPWPGFNTVKGLTGDDRVHLDRIIEFYRTRGRKVQLEIVPSRADGALLSELAGRGLYQSGFHASLVTTPAELTTELPDGVEIRKIDADRIVDYATIHCRGFGLPDAGIAPVAANNRVLLERPGWTFYLAFVSGQPAAAGVMYVKERVASLTFAATLPEYRGLGLHGALLRRRISEAKRQGCELVVGQCAFLSPSHRNMERVGMKIGYVRTTWTEMESV